MHAITQNQKNFQPDAAALGGMGAEAGRSREFEASSTYSILTARAVKREKPHLGVGVGISSILCFPVTLSFNSLASSSRELLWGQARNGGDKFSNLCPGLFFSHKRQLALQCTVFFL